MSTRSVWALVMVLVVLVGAYWLLVTGEQRAVRHDEQARQLLDVQPDDVTALAVRRAGERAVRAVRAGEEWEIVAPQADIPANQAVWNRIAGQTQELRQERTVTERADDLARYGLDAPSLELEVEARNGVSKRIVFGALEPTQTRRYALVDGETVVLVPDRVYREFDRPLLDLRERHLVDIGSDGITWLRYVRTRSVDGESAAAAPLVAPERSAPAEESLAVVVERDAQGVWRMTEPVEAAADAELVEALITEVQYVTARSFIDQPAALADYGLNPPGARISVRSGDGPVQSFALGWIASSGEEGGMYALREGYPSVYVLDGHILTLLPKGPYSFRDHRLFTGLATEIAQIRYRHRNEELVLRNDDTAGWQVGRVEGGAPQWFDDVDQTTVSAFIGALKVIAIASFVNDDAEADFADPLVAMTITMKDRTEREIFIGADATSASGAPQRYARQDAGAAGLIGVFQAGMLSKTAADFRDTRLLRFDAAAVATVTLRLDGAAYGLARTDGAWRLQGPGERPLDDATPVEILLKRLQGLRATGVATVDAGAETGLDAPVLDVALAMGTGETVGPLRVGALAGDGLRYATVAGRPEVFTLEHDMLEGVRDAVLGLQAAGAG